METWNGWISTYQGGKFDIFNPKYEDINILDIAHALSNICRFGGHTKEFYSVAQHSVLVCDICPEYPLEALLHDATEAYCGDMVRPMKHNSKLKEFRTVEDNIHKEMKKTFCLRDNKKIREAIKEADNIMVVTEKRDLLEPGYEWESLKEVQPRPWVIEPWPAKYAEKTFLSFFEFYFFDRGKEIEEKYG